MRVGVHGATALFAIATIGCKYSGAPEQDAAPLIGVGFQFPASLTDERVGTHTVSVALASESTETVTVDIDIDGGTAKDNEDYSLITPTITFLPGETRAEVELSISDDGAEEEDETIDLKFGRVTNAVVVHDTHRVTISRNYLPRVQFAQPDSNVPENGASAQTFTITMDMVAPVDAVFAYGVAGTAAQPDDHDAAPNIITIPAGMMSHDLVVDIVNDVYDEENETIDLTLTAQSGCVVGATNTHIHTIGNDDPPPTISFDAPSSAGGENGGTQQLAVSITPLSGKTVTIDYAVTGGTAGGGEYAISTGPLNFPPGVGTRYVQITPTDDGVDEEDETISVGLSNPGNATLTGNTSHVFAITDDDAAPTLSWSASAASSAEDVGAFNLTVTKSAASERIVTFNVSSTNGSAGGSDYSVPSGPYTIPIGNLSVMVPVTIAGDSLDENSEDFTLGFTNLVNASAGTPATYVGTITDDDVGASWTTADKNVGEGNGSATDNYVYTVTLDASSSKTVLIDVSLSGSTASIPGDATVSPTSLTFNPGTTTRNVTVTVQRDNTNESNETVVMTLQSVAFVEIKSPATATHTIIDDD